MFSLHSVNQFYSTDQIDKFNLIISLLRLNINYFIEKFSFYSKNKDINTNKINDISDKVINSKVRL